MVGASIVVCTRNRAGRLRECLGYLDAQVGAAHDPAGVDGHEVIVVDNGSTDGTGDVLRAWAAGDPDRRRHVHEPVAGLSRARNRGVQAAEGGVVLFLDDDAVAPRRWLDAHLRAYHDPDVVAAGGPVVLRWPDGRPRWLAPRLEHWYSALDLGDDRTAWPTPHGPYGTNMSVRRRTLDEVGGFDPRLGRRGRSLLSSEEGDLFARVFATGGAVAYEPAALVLHGVTPDRLSRRWVLRRGWAQGRSNARRQWPEAPSGWRDVARVCRAEVGTAASDLADLARLARARDQAGLLDEVARRSGHLAAAVELARLRTGRDVLARSAGTAGGEGREVRPRSAAT
jgi:glycosyltransferase involved in cell wall biosynthesis